MDKNTMDNLFEELLKEGASLAAEEMGKEAQEDTTEFSEKHKAKMKKLFSRERRKLRIEMLLNYTARIAAALVIVVAVSGLAIFKVDALKVRIWNMFTNTESTNTKVRFNEGSSYTTGDCVIDYIPEDFEIAKEKISQDTTFLRFENGDYFFDVFIRDSDFNLSLDTENADVETVNLNGHEVFYTTNNTTIILTGYSGDNTICMTGNIDRNTMYLIYQGIKFH